MNKSIIIGIVVGVAIAIAIGAFAIGDDTVPTQNISDVSIEDDVVEPEISTESKGRALTLEFSESMSSAGNP